MIADVLIEHEASACVCNRKQIGALMHAAKQGVTHVVACMLFHGVDPKEQSCGSVPAQYTDGFMGKQWYREPKEKVALCEAIEGIDEGKSNLEVLESIYKNSGRVWLHGMGKFHPNRMVSRAT